MNQSKDVEKYLVTEINGVLDSLRDTYDIVQVVDVEECRVLEIQPDGSIRYGHECFQIWNRSLRCANCSGFKTCMARCPADRAERLNGARQEIHSVPIYLELASRSCAC